MIVAVWIYLSQGERAELKTQPYAIQLQISAQQDVDLSVDYDYGYGFNTAHRRLIQLRAAQSESLRFSISAWKTVHALRFNGFDPALVQLRAVNIRQGDRHYQMGLERLRKISAIDGFVVDQLDLKMEKDQ